MDQVIGNRHGFAARGSQSTKLAQVMADGVGTVTIATADLPKVPAGIIVDIVHATTGVVLASARTINTVTSAGVCTYSGAELAATTSHALYPTGTYGKGSDIVNQNGGRNSRHGLDIEALDSLEDARAYLKTVDNLYTDAYLNGMTKNDIDYAVRLAAAPSSF